MKRRVGLIFLAGIGPILVTGIASYSLYIRRVESDAQTSLPTEAVAAVDHTQNKSLESSVHGRPTRIEIPSVGINVPVADGFFDPGSKTWTLSKNAAHYATMTVPANNWGGNTFIYGHNLSNIFRPLAKVQEGDMAYVTTDNGHRFTYRYSYTKVTTPQDISLFTYDGKPMLTLQTCTGLLDKQRRLLWFDLVEVS